MNEIDVPDTALVHCPKVEFDLVRAAACASCASFAGLADRFPGADNMPFGKRFLILCHQEPTKRNVMTLNEEPT